MAKGKEKKLTLLGHLQELRKRLFWSAIAVVITTSISFIFARRIFEFFTSRAPGVTFVYIEVTEMVGTYMKVGIACGIVLALPFLIYQLVMFIKPALTRREKTYLYSLLPAIIISFGLGAAFAYYVLLPPALRFLIEAPFASGIAIPQIRIGNYISVVVKLIFWIGIIFELPVVIFFLAKIGIVSSQWLAKRWKFAIVGSFVIAAIITPTFDPINQSLVAVPLIALYGVSILVAKFARRGQKAESYVVATAAEDK